MPEASESLPKRKRGGQPGNRNRLVHGRYTQAEDARRDEIRAYRRKGRALVILVNNVLKARAALKRRRAVLALTAKRTPIVQPALQQKAVQHPAALISITPFTCHGPPECGPPR